MGELMNYVVTIPVIIIVALVVCLLIEILRCHTHKTLYRELERDLHEVQSEREKSIRQLQEKCDELAAMERALNTALTELATHKQNLHEIMRSNLTSMPWLAGMIADFVTYDLEVEAKKLDWGSNIQREKKVASIREIRAEAKARIAEAKEAVYQLAYIRELYPAIDDIIDTDYMELELTGKVPEYDPIRNYISKEEWEDLPSAQKDQLALDRYVSSRSKSNWQIGRDYELSVAYEYAQKGYEVDTFGSYMGLEDLGRDVIAKKGTDTVIVQCKYWSKYKTIHEKHIFQLYGTIVSYGIEHQTEKEEVYGLFVTNTTLSQMAHKVAVALNISVVENHKMVDFPRIKCNIGRDEEGGQSKIYHLPMDLQYDVTQIKNAGEFYAFTVEEALENGFRRAFRWHGGGD